MAHLTATEISFADRELITLPEAMGFVLVKDYATFKKHFIDKGLRWYRQIGQRVYYRKKDLLDFVEVTGERYPEIRTTLKGPREKVKREFVTREKNITIADLM